MERLYVDYNSTAPLAGSVADWLRQTNIPFANPASAHYSGQGSRSLISDTSDFLKSFFGLPGFNVFYHSGATEGINTIIRGWAQKNPKGHFFCSAIDHSCVVNLVDFLQQFGVTTHFFEVDQHGEFDLTKLINEIKKYGEAGCLVNFTPVNNVLGVVWPLAWAEQIKKTTGCKIHVDAVQVPGKIADWRMLNQNLDAYTFSGHKFGALKGVGFSFFKSDFSFAPLLAGGGQQQGLRSGTENVTGVYTLKLALEELDRFFNFSELVAAKSFIEQSVEVILQDKGEILSKKAKNRNLNTICLVQKMDYPELVKMKFDLAGIDVGSGSACSSGSLLPDRVILALGYDEDFAKSGIRLSFAPTLNLELAQTFVQKMFSMFQKTKY